MEKIFVWLAGADPQILAKCIRLPKSERIKFAGLGTLVLIPAILAFFSGAYALSTLSNNPSIFVAGGLVWFFIVLSFDRFLVSTTHKSSLKTAKNYRGLVCRYFLAIVVGIAISHPFILFYFDQSIKQDIAGQRRAAVEARLTKADTEKSQIQAGKSAQDLTGKKDDREELRGWLKDTIVSRNCWQKLLTLEQSGIKDSSLPCGASSGIPTCANRCEKIQEQIKRLNQEIDNLLNQVNQETDNLSKREAEEIKLLTERLQEIDTSAAKDVHDIEAKYSEDYLARVRALAKMEQAEPHISLVRWFILFFFVFIDVLAITMKVTTPMGEYEQLRDTLLIEAEAIQEAERAVVTTNYTSLAYRTALQAKFNYNAKGDELTALTQATNEFFKEQEKQREVFYRQVRDIAENIKKVKDEETRKDCVIYLSRIRIIFSEAWGKSITLFHEFIKKL